MEDLNLKIKQNLKHTKIWYIIAAIVFLIQFIIDLIFGLSKIISNKISINIVLIAFSDWTWWCIFFWVIGSFFIGIFVEKTYRLPKLLEENSMNNTEYTFLPKKFVLNMTVEIIITSPLIVALLSVLYGQNGAYGLAIIPVIIGHVCFVKAYFQTRKFFNFINKEYYAKIKEQTRKTREQNDKTAKVNFLLNKTGKAFFIKYYNQLKTQNLIDIIDVVQENYTEKAKTKRILNAKKIFLKDLQIETLNIILKNGDGVLNQELLNLAKTLLEKEIAEKIAKNAKKIATKNIKQTNSKIIPDCSLCKYYIDDKNCEIWRKKPTEPCKEFKIIKNPLIFK